MNNKIVAACLHNGVLCYIVITQHSYPSILQVSRPCYDFKSVWSTFPRKTNECHVLIILD